jgi:hypothetical protein
VPPPRCFTATTTTPISGRTTSTTSKHWRDGQQPDAGAGERQGALAAVEYGWFCQTFGRATEPLPFDDDDVNADLRVEPDETTEGILAFYGRARAAADQVIDELELDATGTAWFGDAVSLRWVLIHMVEETARHAGHVDIVRELIDGMTGDHRPA